MECRIVRCHTRFVGSCSNVVCSALSVGVVGVISAMLTAALVCQAQTVSLPSRSPSEVATDESGQPELRRTSTAMNPPLPEQPLLPLNALSSDGTYNETHMQDEEDVVVRFLRIVEQYERDKHNCTAGTHVSLGEGVVQQYGVRRFMAQALATVSRANLLTRFWMAIEEHRSSIGSRTSDSIEDDSGRRRQPPLTAEDGFELADQPRPSASSGWSGKSTTELIDFLYAQVINLVESDDDIFAAGNCYDQEEFEGHHLFCPYAFRLPGGTSVNTGSVERILAKDLSIEYNYLSNSSDWFYPARQKAERIVAERNMTINYRNMRHNDTTHGELRNTSALLVRYEDGHWSKPYFDCGGGFIWMMTYTVPFFGFKNGVFHFKGTSGIDIDLQKVDINQCPLPPGSNETNVFANSSRCPAETTECRAITGLGFRRGSYSCTCKRGFYFPLLAFETSQRYYNGVLVEHEYEKLTKGLPNQYDTFRCLPCSAGCDECEDSSPCVLVLNWVLRAALLGASAIIMCFVPSLAYFIWRYREVKVIKASSPKLMWLTLVGAIFLYCPMIVGYFEPSEGICSARIWLRAIGFSASYGALLLKTWRISVVFRVRSARTLRISDTDLIKRLGILVLVAAVYVSLRTVWGRPHAEPGKHHSGLKTQQCSYDVWDYCQAGGELLLLLWGIRLCIVVRKAPSEFNESRFISWAIYNETLLSLFLSLAMLFLQSPANPDLLYIIQFIHTNLTTTVNLVFLFGSKAYVVYRRKQRDATLTKDDVLLKSKGSTNFRYSKTHKTSFNNEGSGNEVSLLYKDIEEELSRVYTELEVLKRKQMEAENPHIALSPKHSLTAATVATSQKSNAVSSSSNTRNNNNCSSNPRLSINHNGAATVPLLINYSANNTAADASPTSTIPQDVGSFSIAAGGGCSGALSSSSAAASLSNNLLAESERATPPAVSTSQQLVPPPSEPVISNSSSAMSMPPTANSLRTRCTCGSSGKSRAGSSHRYAVTAAAVRKIFLNIDDLKEATPV